MYEDLHKKAKKRVEARMGFYTMAIIFFFTAIALIMLSFYLTNIAFWLRLPIPFLAMVLGIMYIQTFGLSTNRDASVDWKEEEIEKEILKLYRLKSKNLMDTEDLTEHEILELKELERLENKWYDSPLTEDEFV